MNLSGFKATDYATGHGDSQGTSEPLPAGLYACLVESTEERPTKSGTGSYLEFTFLVIQGDYRGRKLWTRLNLNNRSDDAVRIAKEELGLICHAVGVLEPNASHEFHDKPIALKVKIEKRKDNGQLANRVEGYYPFAAAEDAAQDASAAAANGDAPAWVQASNANAAL